MPPRMIRRAAALLLAATAGLSTLLWPTAPASAATSTPVRVQMRDNRYLAARATVALGRPVSFTNYGQVAHDAVDDTGLDLFATGPLTAPESEQVGPLPGAGRYAYVCTFHPEMDGRLDVPLSISKGRVRSRAAVTVRWAPKRPPAGLMVDVQRRRPGSARFQAWRTGTVAVSARWAPAARGRWVLRARVRSTEDGARSGWSPPVVLRVT